MWTASHPPCSGLNALVRACSSTGAAESQPHTVGWGAWGGLFPEVIGSQCQQSLGSCRQGVVAPINPCHLRAWDAQGGPVHDHPLAPCHSCIIRVLHSPDIKHPLRAQCCSGCGDSAVNMGPALPGRFMLQRDHPGLGSRLEHSRVQGSSSPSSQQSSKAALGPWGEPPCCRQGKN